MVTTNEGARHMVTHPLQYAPHQQAEDEEEETEEAKEAEEAEEATDAGEEHQH